MAELEILNWLVWIFCPTSEAASTCNNFISTHSNVLPPIGPIFYFLLFPAVFTILFIMMLMSSVKVAQGNTGIRVLLGVTAFVFIIISGWYPIMLILSEFWYIVIVLMGFVWFLKGHFGGKGGGREGGGGSGKMPGLAMGGLSGQLQERAFKKLSGQEGRMKKLVNAELQNLKGIASGIESQNESSWRAWPAARASASNAIQEYQSMVSVGGIPVMSDLDKKIEEMQEIIKKLDHKKPPHN
jgi:hypothetical protein